MTIKDLKYIIDNTTRGKRNCPYHESLDYENKCGKCQYHNEKPERVCYPMDLYDWAKNEIRMRKIDKIKEILS